MRKLRNLLISGQEVRARLSSVEAKQDGHAQEIHTRLVNVEGKQDSHAQEIHARLANIETVLGSHQNHHSAEPSPPVTSRSAFARFEGSPDQGFGHVTFSQFGEDLVIANLFALLGIDRPSYLDLGANDPISGSNTALLYMRGSRGTVVEANPNWELAWRETRPRDLFLNVGVAEEPGHLTFHFIDDFSGRNTFNPAYADALTAIDNQWQVRRTAEIPTMRLNDIVERIMGGRWPHFLSIDIEGLDHAVLASAHFSDSYPIALCIETRDGAGNDNTDAYIDLLKAKGYAPMMRTWGNLIAVHRAAASALRLG